MTDPLDTAAIRERYFGDDDYRYRTGKTPRRDIADLIAEVERLRAEVERLTLLRKPLMMCNGGEMALVTDMKAYFARPTTLSAGWVGQFQQPKDGSDD